MHMHLFFRRFCYSPIPRCAAVVLVAIVALAWSSPAFCGEIHDAAEDGALGKVKALLTGNPDLVFSKDKDGQTPLYWAALKGHTAVAQLLLASKAEVNAKDTDGRTPLYWAAAEDHMAVVQLLLTSKAEVNAKDTDGRTPLYWAAAEDHMAVVQLLRQHGGHE